MYYVKRLIVLICQSSAITRTIQSLRNIQRSNLDGIMTHTHGNHTNIHILIHMHLKMAEASLFHAFPYYPQDCPRSRLLTSSLVPRLLRSGTQTLNLCRWGEPGIFFSREQRQRQKGGRKALIAHGRSRRLRATERANDLLHIYSQREVNILNSECCTYSYMNNVQNVAFLI